MVRHRCLAAVGMSKLSMRASLPNLDETEPFEDAHGFTWFENGQRSHRGLHHDCLCADKLRFHPRLPILQEHAHNLAEVFAQLLKRRTLSMCAGETGNVTHVELCVGTPLNDCCVFSHEKTLSHGRGCDHCLFPLHCLPEQVIEPFPDILLFVEIMDKND